MMNRRRFVAAAAGLLLTTRRRAWAAAVTAPMPMTVYKSRTCGCCAKWVEHVRAEGFDVQVRDEESMDQLKDELGVPRSVRSCHTALVGRYLIEGHVPASDIREALKRGPKAAGLAVPGMPGGTPGMAEPGAPIEDFEVLAFQRDGSTGVFARH
jgi:hypothetical protein